MHWTEILKKDIVWIVLIASLLSTAILKNFISSLVAVIVNPSFSTLANFLKNLIMIPYDSQALIIYGITQIQNNTLAGIYIFSGTLLFILSYLFVYEVFVKHMFNRIVATFTPHLTLYFIIFTTIIIFALIWLGSILAHNPQINPLFGFTYLFYAYENINSFHQFVVDTAKEFNSSLSLIS